MLKYIKWFYDEEISDRRLDIKDFPSTSVNIVYNPMENVILLIQKPAEQDAATELKRFGFNMLVLLKMFVLLFLICSLFIASMAANKLNFCALNLHKICSI